MFVETRKTAQGTEYWDNVGKKTVFVPAGQEPNFEVTVDPKSMIAEKSKNDSNDESDTNLDTMNVEQLLAFAAQHNIDVPGNMKKEDTIRNHIVEALAATDAE